MVRQLDDAEHFLDARRDGLARSTRDFQAEGDILRYRHVGKQRIGLEHHADIALVRLKVGHIFIVNHNSSRRRVFKTGNHAERRCLAAA